MRPQAEIAHAIRHQGLVYHGPRVLEYKAQKAVVLGLLMIFSGFLSISFHAVAIAMKSGLAPIGHGVWSGFIYIVTGFSLMAAGHRKTESKISLSTGLSIASCILSLILLILSAAGLSIKCGYWENCPTSATLAPPATDPHDFGVRKGMNLAMALTGFVTFLITLSAIKTGRSGMSKQKARTQSQRRSVESAVGYSASPVACVGGLQSQIFFVNTTNVSSTTVAPSLPAIGATQTVPVATPPVMPVTPLSVPMTSLGAQPPKPIVTPSTDTIGLPSYRESVGSDNRSSRPSSTATLIRSTSVDPTDSPPPYAP